MHRFTTFRLGFSLALLLFLCSIAAARGKIAIDGLHGVPWPEDYEIDLQALYPDIDFVILDASRIPMYQILAEDLIEIPYDTIEFDVPPGAGALYAVLDVGHTPGEISYLPIPILVDPEERATTGGYGICHIDSPTAGHYTFTAISMGATALPCRIGIGPSIWEVYPPEDYDAVICLDGFTWVFFRGSPTPLSDSDFQRLEQMLNADGGVGLFYDGAGPIAMKPIVHMRGMTSQTSAIRIDIPGKLTYTLPVPQSRNPLIWHVPRNTGADVEYDYEARFDRPLNFVSFNSSTRTLVNRSWATVHDVRLLEFVGGEGYRISEIGTLGPSEEGTATRQVPLPFFAAEKKLDEALRTEALDAGMTAEEVERFFTKYSWAARVLADICEAGNPVVLYRIQGQDYDSLLPLQTEPEPTEQCRVLWVYSILPQSVSQIQSTHPRTDMQEVSSGSERVGSLHEYGFFRETYGGDALDEMDAWGWHFYDMMLLDSSNYVNGDATSILFHTWGPSPLTQRLSQGVSSVQGWCTSGIVPQAGNSEVVLSGDDDTQSYSPEDPFPPGSYPPVVVARQGETGGRLVGFSDIQFLADLQDNVQFMNNIFDWFEEGATGEGPDIDLPVAVIERELVEGYSGQSQLTVQNLGDESLDLETELPSLAWMTASGQSQVEIEPEGMVTYDLNWSAAGLSPGYYDTVWVFNSNDPNEPSLRWPVRLRVLSSGGVEPGTESRMPLRFQLNAPFPNPFNAQAALSFALPHDGIVRFDLYNVLGQHVERLPVKTWTAGTHVIQMDFTDKPAGLYFLRAEFEGAVSIQKLMLLK